MRAHVHSRDDRRCGSGGARCSCYDSRVRSGIAVHRALGTVSANVPSLSAAVAGLASRIQGTAIGRGAVTRNVAQLAASVALLRLGLAVTGEVVRPAALVAHRGAVVACEAAAHAKARSSYGPAPSHAGDARGGAVALGYVS